MVRLAPLQNLRRGGGYVIEIGLTTYEGASLKETIFYWEVRFDIGFPDRRYQAEQLYAQMLGWA